MMKITLALALVAACGATVYFKEEFADTSAWTQSDWKKDDGTRGDFEHTAGDYFGDAEADKGIKTTPDARFYAISAPITEFSNVGKTLVLQFQVRHNQNLDCGGAYIKVMPAGLDQAAFNGDSQYNIMFGPDICGTSTKRVHAIFNYKGENHLIKKTVACETDRMSHVYTLIVDQAAQTYEIRIDGAKKESGSLTDDWDFLPAKMIKDPDTSKPDDWVDEAMIDDPEDVKPDGYDDIPKTIPDPEAEKPEDWDDESDGEWEAPMLDNPEFKGEFRPKRIDNPEYKGVWVHPEVDNPDYAPDASIAGFESNAFVGFELWQVKAGTIFDNIFIGDSVDEAEAFMAETYTARKDAEKESYDAIEKAKRDKEEEERKAAEAERAAQEEAEADEDEDEDEDEDAPAAKEEL